MTPRTSPPQEAELFRALGDPTRLGLLARLAAGQASIAALAEGTGITRQAVTKHLRVLERAGLVEAERSGRECLYRLESGPLEQGRTFLEQFSQGWEQRADRLRALVANLPD